LNGDYEQVTKDLKSDDIILPLLVGMHRGSKSPTRNNPVHDKHSPDPDPVCPAEAHEETEPRHKKIENQQEHEIRDCKVKSRDDQLVGCLPPRLGICEEDARVVMIGASASMLPYRGSTCSARRVTPTITLPLIMNFRSV
jgi:hypothetical protein